MDVLISTQAELKKMSKIGACWVTCCPLVHCPAQSTDVPPSSFAHLLAHTIACGDHHRDHMGCTAGEGTYGEAFKYNRTVFKIVPIEGSVAVNGAPQKQAGEMAAEALISLTLSRLRDPGAAHGAMLIHARISTVIILTACS
jgi:hypothetical protein